MNGLGSITETVTSGSLFLAVPLAMLAGLVSFLSPCVLPLVPGYLSYITGLTGSELASGDGSLSRRARSQIILGCCLFILGFSLVFVLLGSAFGAISGFLYEYQTLLQRIFGVLVILLGLMFGGWLPGLNREWRMHMTPRFGLWGAPLLGILFGLGWTPCIGPTLTAVLTLAANEGSALRGAILSFAYCLGLGIPFLIVGLAFEWAASAVSWVKSHYVLIMRIGGGLLVIIGVLLVTGWWDQLTVQLRIWFSEVGVAL